MGIRNICRPILACWFLLCISMNGEARTEVPTGICFISVETLFATHEGFEESFFVGRPPLHVLGVQDGLIIYPPTPYDLEIGDSWEQCFDLALNVALNMEFPRYIRWEMKEIRHSQRVLAWGLLDQNSPFLPTQGDQRQSTPNQRDGRKINSAENCRACYIEFFDLETFDSGWLVLRGRSYPIKYTPALFMVQNQAECQAYAQELLDQSRQDGYHFRAEVYTSGDRSTCRLAKFHSWDFWKGRWVIRFAEKTTLSNG